MKAMNILKSDDVCNRWVIYRDVGMLRGFFRNKEDIPKVTEHSCQAIAADERRIRKIATFPYDKKSTLLVSGMFQICLINFFEMDIILKMFKY